MFCFIFLSMCNILFYFVAGCRVYVRFVRLCRDLHLNELTNLDALNTKFLVKRASDAIVFLDDDAEETKYEYS